MTATHEPVVEDTTALDQQTHWLPALLHSRYRGWIVVGAIALVVVLGMRFAQTFTVFGVAAILVYVVPALLFIFPGTISAIRNSFVGEEDSDLNVVQD